LITENTVEEIPAALPFDGDDARRWFFSIREIVIGEKSSDRGRALAAVLDDEGGAHDIKLAPLRSLIEARSWSHRHCMASGLPAMKSTLTLPIIAVSLIGVSARPNAGD
jgi:hypothetical protein